MKAYTYTTAGAAQDVLTLADYEDPTPGPGEVRVKVAYSAINPTDTKRRATGRDLIAFPTIIPNNDGSGMIDLVGEGVSESRLGDRVWIFGAQHGRAGGTASEYVILPARQAIKLPGDVNLAEGACAGVPVVTAHHALFCDGELSSKTVLVTGGTGRVGAYAVQLAKYDGATVIATAGSDENCAEATELGADHVINYKTNDDLSTAIRTAAPNGVDRIVDVAFGANIGYAADVLKPNGVIATYSSDAVPEPSFQFFPLMQVNATIRMFTIYALAADTQDRLFHQVSPLLSPDTLTHRVGETFQFEDMAKAHEAVESSSVHGVVLVNVVKDLAYR